MLTPICIVLSCDTSSLVALLPSLVEGVGTDAQLMQSDGIHPNRAAQPLMLARVWERLRPLLD